VQKFSVSGFTSGVASPLTFQLKLGSFGNAPGYFNGSIGIAVDANTGNVWVADSHNQRVQEFSPSGAFLTAASGPFTYPSPVGVAVDATGNVWAVDQGFNTNQNLNHVLEFNSAGIKLLSFGPTGGAPGQFNHPTYIAVD